MSIAVRFIAQSPFHANVGPVRLKSGASQILLFGEAKRQKIKHSSLQAKSFHLVSERNHGLLCGSWVFQIVNR
jgi:hypothetical protein